MVATHNKSKRHIVDWSRGSNGRKPTANGMAHKQAETMFDRGYVGIGNRTYDTRMAVMEVVISHSNPN